ncbi:hypothetical protein GCM10010251_07330 [Streptomyces aurantiogriseus]|uniref:Uncharacterized protein n=1 Tax=Streptomyces aurantiogriseus TaxID=66870 RepID=A0A918BW67_9ACTN|nr:hypothetical protein GCM10010251_07330 [Streptomyces aurantiogriseus]
MEAGPDYGPMWPHVASSASSTLAPCHVTTCGNAARRAPCRAVPCGICPTRTSGAGAQQDFADATSAVCSGQQGRGALQEAGEDLLWAGRPQVLRRRGEAIRARHDRSPATTV